MGQERGPTFIIILLLPGGLVGREVGALLGKLLGSWEGGWEPGITNTSLESGGPAKCHAQHSVYTCGS